MRKSILLPSACGFALQALCAGGYQPEPWNLAARQKFAEQRFGIIIHWGIYSTYSREASWFLVDTKDEEAYGRAKDGFCPSKFDATEWVRTIKAAGARYLTFTSRHHDGFALWPTKVDDGYNIANTPFGRDVVGELAKACAAEGLQFQIYYSLPDWHRKTYPPGKMADAIPLKDRKPDYPAYHRFMLAQVTELLDSYHPSAIWFDGEGDQETDAEGRPFDWRLDELYDLVHSRKALVVNNNHKPIREREDVQTFMYDLPGENVFGYSGNQPVAPGRPLEQTELIQRGTWAYDITKQEFRSSDEVVAMIARASSRGANLLLNVGPDGSGRFPRRAVETLSGVGEWMAVNGESIYGTVAGGVGLAKDVVSTRKGNALYLHFLNPKVAEFTFKADGGVAEAKCLDGRCEARVKTAPTGESTVSIRRPAGYGHDVVVKLVMK